jgi:hypothetical protein
MIFIQMADDFMAMLQMTDDIYAHVADNKRYVGPC